MKVEVGAIERECGKTWRAQGDDFRTFLGEVLAALSQTKSLVELNP
jgi:hypothetical protein